MSRAELEARVRACVQTLLPLGFSAHQCMAAAQACVSHIAQHNLHQRRVSRRASKVASQVSPLTVMTF